MQIDLAQFVAHVMKNSMPRIAQQDFHFPKADDVAEASKPVVEHIMPGIARGPSTVEIMIGAAAALAALGLFFLLRNALFNHLIERRVPPSSANGASWAFYAFLAATALTTIAGFVVGLWSSIPFLAGGGTVSGVTFVFFLVSYLGALRRAK